MKTLAERAKACVELMKLTPPNKLADLIEDNMREVVEAERAACEQVACNQVYSSTYPVDTGTVGVIADAIAAQTKL